ncbi:MAG: hypothetical protein MJY60_04365 [Bacteroidales bacterium]|nr:hypothetical protein [Bacteroidales bacterium]
MSTKKKYVAFGITPVDMTLCSNILSGSVIPTQICTNTVEVEEYSEGFDGGFDISFDY